MPTDATNTTSRAEHAGGNPDRYLSRARSEGDQDARRIAVVTGSRAEFGLLTSVMHAIRSHKKLQLVTLAAGSHYRAPAFTYREVEAAFGIDAASEMSSEPLSVEHTATHQPDPVTTARLQDSAAVGRGVTTFAGAFARLAPSCVVVLGDRTEAFAAAIAASIAGIPLAHLHGGDRAEGIADEAMRHAISKLAHLHFPATHESAQRLIRMGEHEHRIHLVGSPAIDSISRIAPLSNSAAQELGDPLAALLLHPAGLPSDHEAAIALQTCNAANSIFGSRVLVLAPNHDAGRDTILATFTAASSCFGWRFIEHLPRETFVALLKRLSLDHSGTRGVLIGNSSAGLIEAAATRTIAVNIGPRQAGRERAGNVIDVPDPDSQNIQSALRRAITTPADSIPTSHPYGTGDTGPRIADILATIDFNDPTLIRKRNAY